MDLHVHTRVELIPDVGTGKDPAKWSKFVERLDRDHAGLIGALVAAEEEGPVSSHRAAESRAELASLEERIVVVRITLQTGIGREVMIAMEIEAAAVIRVAAGSRHDVDGAVARQAACSDRSSPWTSEIPERHPGKPEGGRQPCRAC